MEMDKAAKSAKIEFQLLNPKIGSNYSRVVQLFAWWSNYLLFLVRIFQGLDPDPTAPRIPETTRVRTRSRGSGP
jgi:hypothetical protein